MHGGAKQAHAKNIQTLAANILRAHIHFALQTKTRTRRCRGHAMLTRACFRDDARAAHAKRQQHLSHCVVDLVRAGVRQVLALQP